MPDERYFAAKDIQVTLGISRGRAYEIIHQMPARAVRHERPRRRVGVSE